MRLSSNLCNSRLPAGLSLLLILTVTPTSYFAAQELPSGFDELAAQASAARDVDDAPRAIELYQQALQLNPKWQDGWWSLGLLQYESRAYGAATEALTRVLELDPKAAQAQALRGLCEFETGDYQRSLADVQKGIAVGAANDAHREQILHYHEAMLLTRLGRFQEALKAYAPFAEHGVSSPELLIAIGVATLHLSILPKDAPAGQQQMLMAAGDAAYKFMKGDQNAARDAFNQFFQRYPTVPNVHMSYGTLLTSFGPDAATPQFKAELQVSPDSSDALIMLAWSLLMQNRSDEALHYAKRAVDKEPEQAAAQLVLGRALADTGDVAGGIEHLEHGLRLEPDNLEIHIALAKAYSKSGRDDDALRERALCLQMTRNNAAQLAHP